MYLRIRVCALGLTALAMVSVTAQAQPADTAETLDTTRVRPIEPVHKSTAERLADIPGEILKFPFYVLENFTHVVATNPPLSEIDRLISIGEQVHPYVPVVGYGTRSGIKFGFGLRVLKPIIPPDYIRGKWYYSTNDYQSYQLGLRLEQLFTDRLGIDLFGRYKKRPRESFYGIGWASRQDKEANFTLENTDLKAELVWRALPHAYLMLIGGYEITNLGDGRDPALEGSREVIAADPDYGLTAGRLDATRFIKFGGAFEWDRRDSRARPARGTHLVGEAVRYAGVNRSDSLTFDHITLDLRHYIHLWNHRILAFRLQLQRFRADTDNPRDAPIYLVSRLGGIDALRGYTDGRFTDNDLAVVSVEYRYPVYNNIDALVFLDEGRVYANMTDEAFFKDWQYSVGFGLRVANQDEVTAVVQVARSRESTRLYVELGAIW